MISNGLLWESVNQIARTTNSGYQTQDEWNRDLYSVQWGVISMLCDNYENNQKVSDALVNHLQASDVVTNDSGVYDLSNSISDGESDYYRTVAIEYISDEVYYPSTKVNINERATTQRSSIRRKDTAKNRTGYSMGEGAILMLPEEEMSIRWWYVKKPNTAELVLTTVSDDDADYLTVNETLTTNINFPESLFNIFKFEMLQCLGIEMREDLSIEYARFGINYVTKTEIA